MSGGERVTLRFPPIGIAYERDHAVATRDVTLELFEQRAPVLLEVLLHDDFGPDGAEVAGQGVTASLEFAGDGG